MGLTRTIAASPGYGELRTYGCRECGVWVTEGSTLRDQRKRTFGVHKREFPRDLAHNSIVYCLLPHSCHAAASFASN
jgi:hypothetical protein